MEYIQKGKRKRPRGLTLFVILFLGTTVFSFWLSLNFSGQKKNEFPSLEFSEKLEMPKSSKSGGFFDEPVLVTLTTAAGSDIYFTRDGSEPSLKSEKYTGAILMDDRSDEPNRLSDIPTSPRWRPPLGNVFRGTVLRAITVDEHNHKSGELKESFFVMKVRSRYSLPVISLTVDQKDLFGYNKGIYVLGKTYLDKDNYIRKSLPLDLPWWDYPANYMLRGEDAERPVFIELFEPSGAAGFRAEAGVRINGNATRGFPQKSLRICFRSRYGVQSIHYDLFPSNEVKKFNSFVLRNSGNDWSKTMFRDALTQSLLKDSHVDVQDNRQSVVFINGEYWGIHNIRERFDQNYLANKYALHPDSVCILELNGVSVYGGKSEEREFSDLINFVKSHDLAEKANYEYLKTKVDIASFTDFLIANIYFCNTDWPNNNVKFWRSVQSETSDSSSVKDGRWRWILFDTDWGFAYNAGSTADANLLSRAANVGNVGVLFSALLKNDDYRTFFLSRFSVLLNTSFDPDRVLAAIAGFEDTLSPEIQEHINRWRGISSKSEWSSNIAVLKDFAISRPAFQVKQLNEFFDLRGSKQIKIKSK